MQGKKHYEPKLFLSFNMEERIPQNNFYRLLKEELDLNFLYEMTRSYYGQTGNPSIDPVVFFKLLLVGFYENITYDRELMRHCALRLDILYFLNYDVDESLPSHVTLCKTRKRLGAEVFESVFEKVLGMCANAGLISGHTQSIDTAYVDANASIDRMKLKNYLAKVNEQDEEDDEQRRGGLKVEGKAEQEAEEEQKSRKELICEHQKRSQYTAHRKRKWSALEGGKDHKKNNRRFFSNTTHFSPTDPDARVAKKGGKPRMLCFSSLLGVDSSCGVITHISAQHSDQKDSRLLIKGVDKINASLTKLGFQLDNVVADAGFSSGQNYADLNKRGLKGYVPLHGTYKSKREGFEYVEDGDYYLCKKQGIKLPFKRVGKNGVYQKRFYFSSKKDCNKCPFKEGCVDGRGIKKIEHTIHRPEYEQMLHRLKSRQGKYMSKIRMTTVEPVFGSLTQHYGMSRMNTRSLDSAHKNMLLAAVAFNFKKYQKSCKLRPGLTAALQRSFSKIVLTPIIDFLNSIGILWQALNLKKTFPNY